MLAMVLGLFVSPGANTISLAPVTVTKIMSQHATEGVNHNHSLNEIKDLGDRYHGHKHDMSEYHHNSALLALHETSTFSAPDKIAWSIATERVPVSLNFLLERPPKG
jgi:hypothetical protein